LKNALMQQMGLTPGQPLVPSQVPTVPCFSDGTQANNPYLTGVPQVAGTTFNPYFSPSPLVPIVPQEAAVASPLGVVTQAVITPQKVARSDRLEAFPGMVPYKRPTTAEKMGVTMYQPNTSAYQQLMQLQQPFVPVSFTLYPNNAHSVVYCDQNGQLLDTLQVCHDFKLGKCVRTACKYVHLMEASVEVSKGRVTVCRDSVRSKCFRGALCKFYHIPIPLPSANEMIKATKRQQEFKLPSCGQMGCCDATCNA